MSGLVPLEFNIDKESNHVKGKEWKKLKTIKRYSEAVLSTLHSYKYFSHLLYPLYEWFSRFMFSGRFSIRIIYICINGNIIISLFIKLQYIKIHVIDI